MGSGSWDQGVGIGGLGRGSLGRGLGSRIVTPTPLPTPTIFQTADPYSTSHVSRQVVLLASSVFVSNRPRQIVMYPDVEAYKAKDVFFIK